jgi:hypothetical protein
VNNSLLEGVTVQVGSDTYTSDENGAVYIRKREAFTGTASLADFGSVSFSVNESSTDTSNNTVMIYPFVDVTFRVTNSGFFAGNGGYMQGVTVVFDGEKKKTDAVGEAVFRASNGTYGYEAFLRPAEKVTGNVNISTSNIIISVSVPILIDDIRPVPDGSIQLHILHPNLGATIGYTADSEFTIDWGDGSQETVAAGSGSRGHGYTIQGYHLVKIINCEGVGSISGGGSGTSAAFIAALWTVGNSKMLVSPFFDSPNFVYAGADILKNSAAMTSMSQYFYGCSNLKAIGDGIFDGLINVTSVNNIFYNCQALKSLPPNCFSDMANLQDASYCFYNARIKEFNSPFLNCRKITNISNFIYQNTEVEHIRRDTIPAETDQPITTSQGVINYCIKLKTVYIPASITVMPGPFISNCPLLEYIEMESETPALITSNAISTGNNSTFIIYVPDTAVDAYKGATNWITYAERIFPVSQKPAD